MEEGVNCNAILKQNIRILTNAQHLKQICPLHKTYKQEVLHNDVVDGDVNQLDEKPNEAHDCKTNCCCHGNLLELCTSFIL